MDRIAFRKELETLINVHSMEEGSDTPDYILAEYLLACLEAFDKASKHRAAWYDPEYEEQDFGPSRANAKKP